MTDRMRISRASKRLPGWFLALLLVGSSVQAQISVEQEPVSIEGRNAVVLWILDPSVSRYDSEPSAESIRRDHMVKYRSVNRSTVKLLQKLMPGPRDGSLNRSTLERRYAFQPIALLEFYASTGVTAFYFDGCYVANGSLKRVFFAHKKLLEVVDDLLLGSVSARVSKAACKKLH